MGGWARAAIAAVVISTGGWGTAAAQSVTVQSPRGPHYLGDPVQILIVAEGFDEEPTPTIEPPRAVSSAWRLVYRGLSPSVSSSIAIVGGQIRRSKEVKFVFNYELQVNGPGAFSVEPFVVAQGATRKQTRKLGFNFLDVPTTERVGVELELPDAPVYLGERVPVTLRFRLVGEVRDNDILMAVPIEIRDRQITRVKAYHYAGGFTERARCGTRPRGEVVNRASLIIISTGITSPVILEREILKTRSINLATEESVIA